MKTYRALVVDDERVARRELTCLLQRHPEITVAGEASSIDEALQCLARTKPEVVFLDVQLPGESGFDLFERGNVSAPVIFVTAFDQLAMRAFEINALEYLVKPVDPDRLAEAVSRFLRRARPQAPPQGALRYDDCVLVDLGDNPRFVKLASIVCVLAEGDYTRVVTTAGSLGLMLRPLKEWERLLPERHFHRIHRSTLINCEQVTKIEPWFSGSFRVHLKDLEQPLTMSRRQASGFRQRFELWEPSGQPRSWASRGRCTSSPG
jgi:two-component system LytT family response regulator